MNTLIVYAHPEPKSFCGAMRDVAVRTLTENGHHVDMSDLYARQFNPVGGRHDFKQVADGSRFNYAFEQTKAAETGAFASDVATEQKRLFSADLLILQFPLWWFGMPAILKGWVDRVLAAGLTYSFGRFYSRGVFRGRRAMLSMTTGAPPSMYGPDGLDGDIEMLLYPINHGILHFVGYDVLPPTIAYGVEHVPPEVRRQYLEDYRARLLAVDRQQPIAYPPLEAYDDRFQRRKVV